MGRGGGEKQWLAGRDGAGGKKQGIADELGSGMQTVALIRARSHLEVTLGADSNAKLRELVALQNRARANQRFQESI